MSMEMVMVVRMEELLMLLVVGCQLGDMDLNLQLMISANAIAERCRTFWHGANSLQNNKQISRHGTTENKGPMDRAASSSPVVVVVAVVGAVSAMSRHR